MDDQLKKVLQREMEKEADIIMEEVNKDPLTRDAKAPENMKAELFQRIRRYEEQRAAESLSEEDKEFLRLGKIYKKKKKRKKYYLLVAILVIALSGGVITTMGGPSRVFKEVKRLVGGREQTKINTDSDEITAVEEVSEEEAYQKCEDVFGVSTVRAKCFPNGMHFAEFYYDSNMQMAYLMYESEDNDNRSIIYHICHSGRTGSVAKDIEDELIREYSMFNEDKGVAVKEYLIDGYNISRWSLRFEHNELQYFVNLTDFSETEIKEFIKNLRFK